MSSIRTLCNSANKKLYSKLLYNQTYDNPDSFGITYGEHRENLELKDDEMTKIKKYCEGNGIEFMCTAFDFDSVDFLEEININSYKVSSGDVTSLPLLKYIAKTGKPIFM